MQTPALRWLHVLTLPSSLPQSLIYVDHRKYLGFLYLYSTYNNAVVHVFIRLLVNSSNNWKADRLAAEIATPDITSDEDKRTSDDDIKGTSIDIELIEVEPVDSHSHIQSCTGEP